MRTRCASPAASSAALMPTLQAIRARGSNVPRLSGVRDNLGVVASDWRQLLLPANDNYSCRSATG